MSAPRIRVFVLAAAMLFLAGVCFKTLVLHAQAAPVIATQKDVISSPEYKTIETIQDESSVTRRLTDEQLKTLDTGMDSRYMSVRLQTLVALRHADPKHTQAASAMARRGFESRDSMTRTYALTTLDDLNAPDIVPVAQKMLSDRSHYVTGEAHRILTKHSVKN